MRRRSFLGTLASAGGLALALGPGALAADDEAPRLVVVVLRGGLDGLSAVPPHGDPGYRTARRGLALPPPGSEDGIVDLDGTFGLHPALAPLAPLYAEGQLLAVHAASVPYARRSHFDGQDVLENGTAAPFGAKTGWLNRALLHLDQPPALAVGRTIPLLLRGDARVTSADPLRRPRADPWLERMQRLYVDDPQLGPALDEGLGFQALLQGASSGARPPRRSGRSLTDTIEAMAGVLCAPGGPRIAVLEAGGWDTHTGQQGTLSRQLDGLASGLVALRGALPAAAWRRTVVLVVTEFGRTVHPNGTGGTDHGVGGVALLAGGAVAGGRVIADWPGLSEPALLQGRDLRPTTDLRGVFKGVLHDHLQVPERALEATVFPDSASIAGVGGLVRG